jgi:hypothetical protein
METRGSPEPVSFFWLFQHCLSSSKFVITEKKLFIHILIAKQRTVVSVNLNLAGMFLRWPFNKLSFFCVNLKTKMVATVVLTLDHIGNNFVYRS